MERFAKHRVAALLLALLLTAACVLPAAAAVPPAASIPFTEVTPPAGAALQPPYHQLLDAAPQPLSDDEPLRALIVLEKPSLLEMGYAAADVAAGGAAAAYNGELQQDQAAVIAAIEAATGEPLDVVWRLTIVANLLSAWVLPAQMDTIAAVPGVRSVQAEAFLVPLAEEGGEGSGSGGPDEPAAQGLRPDWMNDYTGDGQRIAIIDTGTDEWHRSLNSSAWMYALEENARLLDPDQDLDRHLGTLDLLDAGGVDRVLDDLAVVQRYFGTPVSAADRQEILAALTGHGEAETRSGRSLRKIAFGANYTAAGSYADIAHHSIDEHGSHVAGIAAANLYVPTMACWDPVTGKMRPGAEARYEAPDVTVADDDDGEETHVVRVQGQAPNAQLLVMQVFDQNNGCTESDYMAAIQDALLLGADTVNLSLGSNEPGATFAQEPVFQNVVDSVAESGAIVTAAHGNSFYWTYPNSSGTNAASLAGLPYADDVSFATGGSPATYDTLLSAASAHIVPGGTVRMSDFSSWGVPSTLELKPEITAPGEDILSLNGAHDTAEWLPPEMRDEYALHDNYEEMSGTSMASPQIAGMAALVKEYLKKEYPKEYTPLTDAAYRRIAQSLLMSTAVPMEDPDRPGRYYPVLQQGAGLADAKKAVTANAYITMEGNAVFRPRTAADGKVKAELGASDSGVFLYTFTVHNLDPIPPTIIN